MMMDCPSRCRGVVGVLSGPRPITDWGKYWHTHVIPSVADLPEQMMEGLRVVDKAVNIVDEAISKK
jgi:hypothetical protein